MTRITRRNPLLALAALLGLLSMAGMSAPASAQAPNISTISCIHHFNDLPRLNQTFIYECGPVWVGMKRVVIPLCGGMIGPPLCRPFVADYVEAGHIYFPDARAILARNVFSMNPQTCAPMVTGPTGEWCYVGPGTTDDYVQSVSVVSWF